MKKTIAIVLVALMLFALAACNRQNNDSNTMTKAPAPKTTATETATTDAVITQVVCIAKEGKETKLETLSLSTTGWEDFLKRYPGDGKVTISNLEIDRIFHFEEVDAEYPEEILEFLQKDKGPLDIICSRFKYNNGVFSGEGFYMSYNQSQFWQWTETIEIALETKDDFVKFEINGAINGKKLYCRKPYAENGIEFLIFNKDGRLFAINEKMQMFQLIPR